VSEETKELRREALTITEVCSACGVGRTKIFESIADGSLKARKFGKRTLVLPDDLREFVAALPRSDIASIPRSAKASSKDTSMTSAASTKRRSSK
jgi:excisionase family DNA binding protein